MVRSKFCSNGVAQKFFGRFELGKRRLKYRKEKSERVKPFEHDGDLLSNIKNEMGNKNNSLTDGTECTEKIFFQHWQYL